MKVTAISETDFKDRVVKLRSLGIGFVQEYNEFLVYLYHLKAVSKEKSYYLEIGSKYGGSLYLAAGILPKGSTIICVDLPGDKWGSNDSEEKLDIVCGLLTSEGYIVHKVIGDSTSFETINKIKDVLGKNKLSGLFIDGNHSLEYVTKDWENYSPLVKKGIIGFHDIKYDEHSGINVGILWKELKEKYEHIEIIKSCGLGIIFKGI